ncbi:ScbR family autoregulator-binding transcription factor [Streptomyces sp. NPDC090022]|uniref:ScbR family autoregulator-binding transcription factor n=1 Tax=Streptomyces sp. NPDC090022 TaxID=3365920 RepID=UPI00382E5E07
MTQQERSARTRRLIVEAAGAVFAEKGFNGATIADVYQRVGLTKGAFYYYFTGKEDLARAVLGSQTGGVLVFPLVPRTTRLQELVDGGMVFAHQIRSDTTVQGSLRLSLERGAHELDRRRPYEDWIAHNRMALSRAKDAGELHSHVDPETVAQLLVGAFSGIQVLSEVLSGWSDLEERISVMLQHILPTIALPGPLAQLDMSCTRGQRVLDELQRIQQEEDEAAELAAQIA